MGAKEAINTLQRMPEAPLDMAPPYALLQQEQPEWNQPTTQTPYSPSIVEVELNSRDEYLSSSTSSIRSSSSSAISIYHGPKGMPPLTTSQGSQTTEVLTPIQAQSQPSCSRETASQNAPCHTDVDFILIKLVKILLLKQEPTIRATRSHMATILIFSDVTESGKLDIRIL